VLFEKDKMDVVGVLLNSYNISTYMYTALT